MEQASPWSSLGSSLALTLTSTLLGRNVGLHRQFWWPYWPNLPAIAHSAPPSHGLCPWSALSSPKSTPVWTSSLPQRSQTKQMRGRKWSNTDRLRMDRKWWIKSPFGHTWRVGNHNSKFCGIVLILNIPFCAPSKDTLVLIMYIPVSGHKILSLNILKYIATAARRVNIGFKALFVVTMCVCAHTQLWRRWMFHLAGLF